MTSTAAYEARGRAAGLVGRRISGRAIASGAAILAAAAFVAATLAAGPSLAQRKKITLDDIVVEGNIQKPEAFFILPRTNLNFGDLERREDLKTRIVKSVEKKPF